MGNSIVVNSEAALNETIGLVLAGGRSTRMGQDKSQLVYRESTLLASASKALNQVGLENVIVSSNRIKGALADVVPNCGPISAIHALANSHTGRKAKAMVILPIDMPLLPVEYLKQICLQGHKSASVCYFESHPLPAYIPIDNELRAILECQIHSKDLSLKALFAKLSNSVLIDPIGDGERNQLSSFFNLNTPKDWTHLLEQDLNVAAP